MPRDRPDPARHAATEVLVRWLIPVAFLALAACEQVEERRVHADSYAQVPPDYLPGYVRHASSGLSEPERMVLQAEQRYMGSPLPPPAEHPASPYQEPYRADPGQGAPTPAPGDVLVPETPLQPDPAP